MGKEVKKDPNDELIVEELNLGLLKGNHDYLFTYASFKDSVVDSEDFLQENIPEPDPILSPALNTGDFIGICSQRGVGKTFLALSMAIAATRKPGAISIGTWISEKSLNTLYIDGEMSEYLMQDRYKKLSKYLPARQKKFSIFSAARLAKRHFQSINLLDPLIRQIIYDYVVYYNFELLIFDNLSVLASGRDEMKKEDWDPIGNWIISLRHIGKTIILLGHMGKDEKKGWRGIIGVEDCMDCSIHLTRPKGYKANDGCYFQVEYSKPPRNLRDGDALNPFTFKIQPDREDGLTWRTGEIKVERDKVLIALIIDGVMKQKEIAETMKVTPGWVSRKKDECVKEGYIDASGKLTDKGKRFLDEVEFEGYYEGIE